MGVLLLGTELAPVIAVIMAAIILPIFVAGIWTIRMVYNAYFHKLSHIPGPKLWAASHLPRHWAACTGNLEWKIKELHEKYGEVVRYSPDELSFTSEHAWQDIYGHRGQEPLAKDPSWYNATKSNNHQVFSIVNADHASHNRIRKQLAPAFSARALGEQESIVTEYVDLCISKLHDLAMSNEPADLVKWYNYLIFDLIGDLALGKSFGCLNNGQYHGWVASLSNSIKIGPFVRAIGQYMDAGRLMRVLAPASVKEARAQHEAYVASAASERLSRGLQDGRRDFISHILEGMEKSNGLSRAEFAANCGFIMLAGSETTATALSGITYHLLSRPEALSKATQEIRKAFKSPHEITFMSTAAQLPYIDACITEGMRIYPPTPNLFPRRTPPNKAIEIAGQTIPPWTSVGVHVFSANHSANNYHSPELFAPERWLKESSTYSGDKVNALQPFSVGPRNCLGKNLALNEMRTILARMLFAFDMELMTESKGWAERQKSFTFWSKGSLMVRLRSRAGSSE